MYNCNAGRRVDCIIGSACIRDFSTATEVLQGKAGATGPQLHHHLFKATFQGAIPK